MKRRKSEPRNRNKGEKLVTGQVRWLTPGIPTQEELGAWNPGSEGGGAGGPLGGRGEQIT